MKVSKYQSFRVSSSVMNDDVVACRLDTIGESDDFEKTKFSVNWN